MIINVNLGKDGTPLTASDIFPFLKAEGDGGAKEMTTAETVQHLRDGFKLYVPTRYREALGLPPD
jgi:hypothetical protein